MSAQEASELSVKSVDEAIEIFTEVMWELQLLTLVAKSV